MSNADFTKDFLKSISLLVSSIEKLLDLRRYREENGAGASACHQFGNGEHFVSHSQGRDS